MIEQNFLIQEYKNNNRTISDIAKQLEVNYSTVYKYLKKYNICIEKKPVLTKEFLHQEYIINMKKAVQIAKEVGMCQATILSYLRYYGFTTKKRIS